MAKTQGQIVKDIVLYFLSKTNQSISNRSVMAKNVNITKKLLEKYSPEDIKLGIDYNIEHPPAKGFYSLAWLEYCLDDIVYKEKANVVKQQIEILNEKQTGGEYNVTSKYNRNNIPTWIRKGYSLDLFKSTGKDS